MTSAPLFLRHDGRLKKINSEEIILLSAVGNYVKFVTVDQLLTVRTTMNKAMKLLPPRQFLQVHRTYAVALYYVKEISRNEVIVHGIDEGVPVSKQFYPGLLKQLTVIGTIISQIKKD